MLYSTVNSPLDKWRRVAYNMPYAVLYCEFWQRLKKLSEMKEDMK